MQPPAPSPMPEPAPLPEQCEVLVVGAGPTGLYLAALLAGRGVDVLVLDRRAAPSTHSRAIGLHPPAIAALEQVGLARAAVAAGEPIRAGIARSGGRRLGRLHFAQAWPERPFVLSLPQSRTEEMLADRLAALAPDALRRGWELVGLDQHADNVDARVRPADPAMDTADRASGVAHQEAPAQRASGEIRARVVVGADGSRSRVRILLGIGTVGLIYRDTYLMGDVVDPRSGSGQREAVIYLEPDGVVESFPLPGGRRRWVAHTGVARTRRARSRLAQSGRAQTPPAAVQNPSPEVLATIVHERTGEHIDPATSTMISAFTVRRRLARRMVSGRAVLIGDAAHEISPIGGQGITVGWLDALALAPLVERLVRRDPGGPLTDLPEFTVFERVRAKAARRAARMAQLNMTLGRPAATPIAHGRSALVGLLLASPARHAMAWVYSMGWARHRPR